MVKIRTELTEWFTVLARYVGMTGLVFEVSTKHDDPIVIGVLTLMMGFGHIIPSRTARTPAGDRRAGFDRRFELELEETEE